MSDDHFIPETDPVPLPKGGLYGGPFNSEGLDPNIRSLLFDVRWTTEFGGSTPATIITYSFPTLAEYGENYQGEKNLATKYFEPTDAFKSAVRTSLDLLSSYTNMVFVEAASGTAEDSALRFSNFDDPKTSFAYIPPYYTFEGLPDSATSGDAFFGVNGHPPENYFGTDHFNTIMHEIGHALGLKHGHESDYNGTLAREFNDNEFSVMTYASYLGSPTGGATEARVGSSPFSYMMFDIAALQALYGANFSKLGTTAVYRWDPLTGQQYINDVAAPFTGVSDTHKIFTTVWTQGAETTYDLSAFNEDQVADLRPGQWLTFSRAQLADLNSDAEPGTVAYQAQGNVYNALLYDGDTRSAVKSVITGDGNDIITGNDLDNVIIANAGDDTISSGLGNNIISGGEGADTILFGTGHNLLRDTLADLNGDVVYGLGLTSAVQILGSRIAHAAFDISLSTSGATFNTGGSSFLIDGDFSDGSFMTLARGTGADAYTSITFENLLPALAEKQSVSADLINGIANNAFLTGDGTIGYSVELQMAVSGYHNMLGTYNVSVDGTISDVRILFADTLATSTGTTVNLGTPDAGEQVGFFLIQDGFNTLGALPSDLSFVWPDAGTPADLDSGTAPLLYSSSRGLLSNATVFHSFATFNPGDLDQVLSGVSADGTSLRIGFEDLARASGDNDFQDVVIAVRGTDGFLLS